MLLNVLEVMQAVFCMLCAEKRRFQLRLPSAEHEAPSLEESDASEFV